MAETIDDIKKEIIELFNDKNNTYDCSDRLQVALHEIVDDFVTRIFYEDVLNCLKDYSSGDFSTLDGGMYEGALERGFEDLCRVLLYCLIEQELYNDTEFNELQNVEEVAGIILK